MIRFEFWYHRLRRKKEIPYGRSSLYVSIAEYDLLPGRISIFSFIPIFTLECVVWFVLHNYDATFEKKKLNKFSPGEENWMRLKIVEIGLLTTWFENKSEWIWIRAVWCQWSFPTGSVVLCFVFTKTDRFISNSITKIMMTETMDWSVSSKDCHLPNQSK